MHHILHSSCRSVGLSTLFVYTVLSIHNIENHFYSKLTENCFSISLRRTDFPNAISCFHNSRLVVDKVSITAILIGISYVEM